MTEETVPQKPLYKRWEIMVPTVIAAVIVVGYSVIWFAVSGTVRSQLEEHRRSGLGDTKFDYNAVNISGYPFGLRVRIDGPSASGNNWSWQGESVSMRMSIFSPRKISLLSSGTHSVVTDGRRIRINLEKAVSNARIGDNGWTVDIDGNNISTAVDGKPAADIADLDLTLVQDFSNPRELEMTVNAENATLTVVPPVLQPLKTKISAVKAIGALTDIQHLTQKGRTGQYPGLRIDSSEIIWGPMNASIQGDLGLDSSSRAQGQVQLGLNDIERLQRTLRSTESALPSRTTFILELIKRTGNTTVPITIDAGQVSLSGFPIGTIPPLKSKR